MTWIVPHSFGFQQPEMVDMRVMSIFVGTGQKNILSHNGIIPTENHIPTTIFSFSCFSPIHRYRTYLLLTNFFCTDFCSFCMVFILPCTFIFPFIYLNIFSFFVPFLTSFPENICKSIKIFKFNC